MYRIAFQLIYDFKMSRGGFENEEAAVSKDPFKSLELMKKESMRRKKWREVWFVFIVYQPLQVI